MSEDKRYQLLMGAIYELNPKTGEKIHDLEQVKQKIREYSCLEDYAFCEHDRDMLTKNDIKKHLAMLRGRYEKDVKDKVEGGLQAFIEENQYLFEGKLKGKHLHFVIRTKNGSKRSIERVAAALGISPNEIQIVRNEKKAPTGMYKYMLDVVYYFTHKSEEQQDLGKAIYEWSEIEGTRDWEKEFIQMREQVKKYGRVLNEKDAIFEAVAYEGLSLKKVRKEHHEFWCKYKDKLEKLAADYLSRQAPMPLLRLNYYIDGDGGIGKNTACKALAKALFPKEFDDECYFEVGGDKVSFDKYEGQPVIIWNDVRAVDLVMRFGHGEVFDIFDSHPTNANHNIKYGSIRLTNAVNIVNGIQPFKEFLDGLAGEYIDRNGNLQVAEDKGQAYRRFPIIMCLRESDFDVLLNKGVAEGTREYEQYIATKQLQGSFAKLAIYLEGKAKETVAINMLSPVLDMTEKIKAIEQDKISQVDDIPEEFLYYGKTPEQIAVAIQHKEDELARLNEAEIFVISAHPTEVKKDGSAGIIYLRALTLGGRYIEVPIKKVETYNDALKEHLKIQDNLRKQPYIRIGDNYHPLLRTCKAFVKEFCNIKSYVDDVLNNIDILSWYDYDSFYGNLEDEEPTDEQLMNLYDKEIEDF